ncbi:MAG: DUF504 domain-containing protein [Alphaproteobacteria bacterium]|nr:DUF504 domain-containing protein [Alphaproteobacteria bacterium]
MSRFPTSEQVYSRLRWDAALSTRGVRIGYTDRHQGLVELPFEDFVPGGVIPWSRVQRFRIEALVLWDRAAREERLFGDDRSGLDALRMRPLAVHVISDVIRATPWRWRDGAWAPWDAPTQAAPGRLLTLLSWNILFDRFDPEQVRTEDRLPAILDTLVQADADLVALQEVTPTLLQRLLAHPPIQRRYWSSEGPEGASVAPYGNLLLSRIPPAAVLLRQLSPTKRAVLMAFDAPEAPLWVASLHLSSDRARDRHALREEEAARLLEALPNGADVVLAGDFNYGDDRSLPALEAAGFVDLHGAAGCGPGITYDPHHNRLAALTSRKDVPRRLDRVWLRADPARLRPAWLRRAATTPIPGVAPPLPPSDHYALQAGFARGADLPGDTTPLAALCVLLPEALQAPIQRVREARDKAFGRWPPHLNLRFPFLPAARFDDVARALAPALRALPPFEVTLDRVRWFTHRRSTTLWLGPRDPAPLQRLHAMLDALLPGLHPREAFAPHLTLGQLRGRDQEDVAAIAQALEAQLGAVRFTVDRLALLARGPDTPFAVDRALPLEGRPTQLGDLGLWAPHPVPPLPELPDAAIPGLVRVEVVGSRRLGLGGGDVDLLLLLRPDADPDAALAALVRAQPGRWRLATGRTTVARSLDEAHPIDVTAARLPEGAGWPLSREDLLQAPDARALAALTDADAVLGRAAIRGGVGLLRCTLRGLRRWARARQLHGDAWGFLGGLSWALLVVDAMGAEPRPGHPEAVARQVFTRLAEGGLHIPAPTPPHADTARNTGPSTARALAEEARRALALADEDRWEALRHPFSLQGAAIEVRGEALPGRAIGLVRALDGVPGLTVRPCPRPAAGRWRLGLRGSEEAQAQGFSAAEAWCAEAGVSARRVP